MVRNYNELKELNKLKNQEIITEEEFNIEKERILNQNQFTPISQVSYKYMGL